MKLWITDVSIHALLAECDIPGACSPWCMMCFNPRTPCGVRRGYIAKGFSIKWFQSTHSLRSATLQPSGYQAYHLVSIHALLAECDIINRQCPALNYKFQSTHSLRSATHPAYLFEPISRVSIHALLAECDWEAISTGSALTSFNPRTPCGVRLGSFSSDSIFSRFNPRTPCGVRLQYSWI